MANLTPASTFDNVYQLETTDPVLAGAGGISNRQAQQLLNRTTYLKSLIDALDGSGGPFDFDASGGVLPTTGSGSGGTIKRKDTYKVSVAGTVSGNVLQVGDTLIAKIDGASTAANYILLQTNVDLATASVLGLVKLAQNIAGGSLADTCLSLAGLISIFAQITYVDTADNTLQININSEASARSGADTTLQNNINSEASTRASADTTLQNNITSEASTRSGADTTLQNNINSEATTRSNADTALDTAKVNRSGDTITGTLEVDGGLRTLNSGPYLKTKVIDIGAWNMDTTPYFTVNHGLSSGEYQNIVSCQAMIYIDGVGSGGSISSGSNNGGGIFDLCRPHAQNSADSTLDAGIDGINSTRVALFRNDASFFNNAAFSVDPNRGRILITYF